jgi:hypothetical protein
MNRNERRRVRGQEVYPARYFDPDDMVAMPYHVLIEWADGDQGKLKQIVETCRYYNPPTQLELNHAAVEAWKERRRRERENDNQG